ISRISPKIRPLLLLLADDHVNSQCFPTPTPAGAGDRRRRSRIEAAGEPHVTVGRADVVGGIESYPSEIGDPGFSPSVVSDGAPFAFQMQVAGYVASRNRQLSRGGDEDMRVVLTNALTCI